MANRGNSNLHDSSKNKRDEFYTRHFDTRKKINADTFGYNAKDELTNSISHSPFSILHSYSYDAFGNIIAQSGPMADSFRHRFSTKYLDAETGLYYYGYRFYSPELMRWLNRDPIGEDGGVNLYGYCINNALSRVDSNGHASIADYVLANMGYDCSFPILGPYVVPVPALAARLQIQVYVSGNYASAARMERRRNMLKER